jgi:pimeloyl-ACP methyl ester carboxylesterase
MRHFQNLLAQLKEVEGNHRPGELIQPPKLLQFIENQGRRLYYTSMGEGNDVEKAQPVILIHGFGGFFMDWPRVMAPLARHTRVYAIDLPGWGFSDPNFEAKSLEDDVQALQSFIQALGLRNVILCGLSYGAGVAWAAAAMHLPRVEQIVLLNPMPTYPLQFMRSILYRTIFFTSASRKIANIGHKLMQKAHYKIICKETLLNFRLLDSFYLDLAYKIIKQPKVAFNLHQQARGAREVSWSAWESRLGSVDIPVTILQGKEDKIFSMQSARHLQSLIPNAELVEVPNCGHAMVFDQHRKVSEFLASRLREVKEDEGNSQASGS